MSTDSEGLRGTGAGVSAPDRLAWWVGRWRLVPDGAVIVTHSSRLLPVRRAGAPAMLKVAHAAEERAGAALMTWWGGDGAMRVLAREGDALLLERATGSASLASLSRTGADDDATRVLCAAAARLHAPRAAPPPPLVPLTRWFAALAPAASAHGGVLVAALRAARQLLDEPRDVRVLHGDLHHGNVLDAGARGWCAIDPKGLVGERGFDFAPLFCNPGADVALAAGRLARQSRIVADAAGIERARLLRWILAFGGLSAAWSVADGDDATIALGVATLAAAELAACD